MSSTDTAKTSSPGGRPFHDVNSSSRTGQPDAETSPLEEVTGGSAASTTAPSAVAATASGTTVSGSPIQGEGADDSDGEDQPCQACGVFPARFQCSACQSVRYCSQECQASDWGIHYRECAEIIAAIKEEQLQESRDGTAAAVGQSRPRSRTSVPRHQQGQGGEACHDSLQGKESGA